MGARHIRVSSGGRDSACVVTVNGELTLATEREFAVRTVQALAAFRGPVRFDVSGVEFADCHGARALARAISAASPRPVGLEGANPVLRRLLAALALDLQQAPQPAADAPGQPGQAVNGGDGCGLSHAERLAVLTRTTRLATRQSAVRTSEVMARLAATYAELALSSRYRTRDRSEERGRLLALSGRAHDLSRQYMSQPASEGDARSRQP
ncbi:MAG TPA: STAS domain-containing protein [Trebonia sp.]